MDNQPEPNPAEDVRALALSDVGITRVNLQAAPRSFADVMEEIAPQGEASKLTDFEGQQITIVNLRFFNGRWGPAAFVLFTNADGVLFNMVVGAKIVLPKLAIISQALPVTATVVKREGGQFGEYWDLE